MAYLIKIAHKVNLASKVNFDLLLILVLSAFECRNKKQEITYTDSAGNVVRLRVVEKGKEKPILFLHGNSFTHGVWKKQFQSDNPSPPIAKVVVLSAAPSNGFSREPDFRDYPAGPLSPEINYLLKNFFLNPSLSDEVANNFIKMVLGNNPATFETASNGLDEQARYILHQPRNL